MPTVGSLNNDNDNDDGTENGKKAIGLISKTVTLHVHHAFLYIFSPSLHGYDVKLPNFTFCGGCERKTTTLFFFSWTLIQSVRIQLQKKSPNLTNWTRWKKLVKVWSRANILFKRRFGTGDTFSKGATIFFEHYNELPLSCTTFLTTFVRDCTSVHKNRFTTCAVFLSFHVNFVHIFPQPACLDSITFPAVCAFVVLSTLIKKIRENRSVRNALKRNRRLERWEWQARRIVQVWRKKKRLTQLSSKISRFRTIPSLRTQTYFRSSLRSTRWKRWPEIRLRSQQEWFAGYTTPITAW